MSAPLPSVSRWDRPRLSLAVAALALVVSSVSAWQSQKNRQRQPGLVVDSVIEALGKGGLKDASGAWVNADSRVRYTATATNTGNVALDRARVGFFGPPTDEATRTPKSCFVRLPGATGEAACLNDSPTEEALSVRRLKPGQAIEVRVDYDMAPPSCRRDYLEQSVFARSAQTGETSTVKTSAWFRSYPELVPKSCKGKRYATLQLIPVTTRRTCGVWSDYSGSAIDAVSCFPTRMKFAAYLTMENRREMLDEYRRLAPVKDASCGRADGGGTTSRRTKQSSSGGYSFSIHCGYNADGDSRVVWYEEPDHIVGYSEAATKDRDPGALYDWWWHSG